MTFQEKDREMAKDRREGTKKRARRLSFYHTMYDFSYLKKPS